MGESENKVNSLVEAGRTCTFKSISVHTPAINIPFYIISGVLSMAFFCYNSGIG